MSNLELVSWDHYYLEEHDCSLYRLKPSSESDKYHNEFLAGSVGKWLLRDSAHGLLRRDGTQGKLLSSGDYDVSDPELYHDTREDAEEALALWLLVKSSRG